MRVDEQQRVQFGRIADLAGVSPPMTEERALAAEIASRHSKLNAVDGTTRRKKRNRADSVVSEKHKDQSPSVYREY